MDYGLLRNPIYPNAMRLCDVHNGVPYRKINAMYGVTETSIFLGEPFVSEDTVSGGPTIKAKVLKKIYLAKKLEAEIYLGDAGIVRYGGKKGWWNEYNFTIKDTPAGIKLYQKWLENGGKKIIKAAADKMALENREYGSEDELDDEY